MKIKSKKGIIGVAFSTILMTVIIIAILTVFFFGSGLVKQLDNVRSGVRIYNELDVGLGNIFDYVDVVYGKIIHVRFLMQKGNSLESSLSEVGYEK